MKKWIIMIAIWVCSVTCIAARTQTSYNVSPETLIKLTAKVVPAVFAKNHTYWNQLILGTLASETGMGSFKGSSRHGVTQITPVAFKAIQRAVTKQDRQRIQQNLGIDVKKVSFGELEWNHTLSIVFTSLFYKTVISSGVPPKTVEGCAIAWKKHYNTYLGAGTTSGFQRNYKKYVLCKGVKHFYEVVEKIQEKPKPKINYTFQPTKLLQTKTFLFREANLEPHISNVIGFENQVACWEPVKESCIIGGAQYIQTQHSVSKEAREFVRVLFRIRTWIHLWRVGTYIDPLVRYRLQAYWRTEYAC